MKHLHARTTHAPNQYLPHNISITIDRWPCSEEDILRLQDIFLTPGIHQIKTESILFGRHIIEHMLAALGCFKMVAALSVESTPLPPEVIDVYEHLKSAQALNGAAGVHQFFTEELYADFVWIEETAPLRAMPWFDSAQHALVNYGGQIPIVSALCYT